MRPLWTLILTACAAPSEPVVSRVPVTATVDVSAPWSVVPGGDDEVALRFEDSPHGVRVFLTSDPHQPGPGAALVVDGRTIGAPLFAVPQAIQPAHSVTVRSEGYDLLVRFASEPLSRLTADPEAPDDAALTWLRIRPRNGSWRLVLDGLGQLTVPATDVGHTASGAIRIDGSEGTFEVTTDAPVTFAQRRADTWHLDTTPSLHERQPYPRTGITYRPLTP